jgi:DNA-binding transcriptional LysR family regulator
MRMKSRTLDLQALRIFKAVADEQSITRAAAQLHYVQSNVTTRLRNLETELGVPLFHRAGGRLVITPAGLRLRSYAERLLKLAEEAKDSIVEGGGPRGTLAIGAMETTAAARLPRMLAAFHAAHPAVDLTIETGPTDHLVKEVLEFRIDAALVGGAVRHAALISRPVFDEELVLIASVAQAPIRTPADVARALPVVFRAGCSYRRRLEQWLESGGVVPRRAIELGTFEGIIGCVAAGMGISLMPRVIVEQRRLGGLVSVHEVPARFAAIRTHLVWRREAAASPARDAFLDLLVADAEDWAQYAPRTPKKKKPARAHLHKETT